MASGSDNTRPKPLGIGVLGAGAWGNNLVRNVAQCLDARLLAVCDASDEIRTRVKARYADTAVFSDFDAMLDVDGLDAVIVATPPNLHYAHARRVLDRGLHVLVEKPICTRREDAADLCRIADERGLVIMCGHTVLYNSVVHEVRRRMQSGELGDIRYLYCRRLNLGRVRPDVDALWNLAPHDISMMCYLLDAWPTAVNARGWSYLQPSKGIADVCFFQMEYAGGVAVSGHVSWLDPQKDRSVVVVGSERMLVYDDLDPSRTLQVYDKGVEVAFQSPMEHFADYTTRIRSGDLVIPNVRTNEPLAAEIEHFVECVRTDSRPLSDGRQGLALVNVLEAMSRSMNDQGRCISVDYDDDAVIASSAMPVSSVASRSRETLSCSPSPSTILTPNI